MKVKILKILILLISIKCTKSIFLTGRAKSDISDHLTHVFRIGLHDYVERQTIGNPQIYSEYDFIVIGGGSSGCVIANRLSENPNTHVLLIEAGGTENFLHQIPMMAAYFQGTASNWGYLSEPQKQSCFAMKGNQCALPRGKVLGGTSSINYMIYNRGNRNDFNDWAAAGNPGWSYQEVLPYFKKSENANLKGLQNSFYHGKGGPLSVSDTPYRSNLVKAFVKAAKQAGHPETDYNGESQLGVSYIQGTTKFGHRQSAAKAFIDPIRHRKNLHVITDSRVSKILIDPKTKEANGVQFINKRKKFNVYVRKEVILSAGSFNSPQILMLSGIGPANNLNAIGIPVIKELPVGKILYDHMCFFGPTFILNSTGNTIRVKDISVQDVIDFKHGGGRLSILGGVEALTFIKTPNSHEPRIVPDAEIIFVSGSFASDEGTGLKQGANLRDDVYNKVWKPIEHSFEDHYSVLIMHFHPKSKGQVWAHNRDPFTTPKINPKYFHDPDDVETILHGIKAAIKISQAPALQRLGTRLHNIPIPGCEHLPFSSDDYWRCAIRALSYTLHHQVATCKMGPETDPTSVVNYELKVHGIKKLRVADTGIIPKPPTAHTHAIAVMIGEKISDMIKTTWNIS